MVILGGSGNNRGVVLGAFLYYAFDWVSTRLKDLPALAPAAAQIPYVRFMVIGVLLVLLVLYRPEGILREKKGVYPPVT
jgi:ABC-type branched-subunit amino acid transport system permease subunit